jgi:hypothetical protein
MAFMTYFAEKSFVGARPYAAGASVLMFLALSITKK